MILVKDLESEKSSNNVIIQKFKNNITRLTGEITVLESDKETDKPLFDIDIGNNQLSGRRLLAC